MTTTPVDAQKPVFSKEMTVLQRMHAVRQRIEYIKKEKKVEGYMAVTHDQVTDLLREHLIEFGVLVLPSMVPGTARTEPTGTMTAKKVPFVRFQVDVNVAFINVDDRQDREIVMLTVHAIDHGDKAPGKALSYAVKGAELKAFNIVTGEHDDEERPEQEGGMHPKDEEAWKSYIDKLSSTSQIDGAWQQITNACAKVEDRQAYTRLRAHMSAKKTALEAAEKQKGDKTAAKKAA